MRKRFLAALLAVMVTVAGISGCGGQEKGGSQEKETSAPAKETASASTEAGTTSEQQGESEGIALDAFKGTELTIAVARQPNDKSESYNDKPAFRMAEEATGIHINWIEVPQAELAERKATMLAGDMPDAFMPAFINEVDIRPDVDLFYDFSEEGLLETYAPNVLADMKATDGVIDGITWPDGSWRSLPGGLAASYDDDARGIWYINKAWLDQLGLDVPQTMDEFVDALKAFRDNDCNGNGDPNDEVPLLFCNGLWCSKLCYTANYFGIATGKNEYESGKYMIKNGKVTPSVDTDNYRAWLEWLHMLVEEKLINVDGFSMTTQEHSAVIAGGQAGVFGAWDPSEAPNPEDYVVMPLVQALEGVKPVKSGQKNHPFWYQFGLLASADCSNIQALLHWWNYLASSTEMKYTLCDGEKGVIWDFLDDGSVVVDIDTGKIPEGYTLSDYPFSFGTRKVCPLVRADELSVVDPVAGPTVRRQAVDQVWDQMQDEYMPVRIVDYETAGDVNDIYTEMCVIIDSFCADSAMNGVTDESWNSYLEELDSAGYYRWIDWWQKFYDGTF